MRQLGVTSLATVIATGMLVAVGSAPAVAAPAPLVSLPFTGATQEMPYAPPGGASGTIAPLAATPGDPADGFQTGFPCLTASADVHGTPVPGCGLAPPDTAGSGVLRLNIPGASGDDGLTLGSTLPTSDGLVVTFDQYQYGSGFLGDGMAIALAAAPPSELGFAGGDLGYKGLSGGYLGVGFDVAGNYASASTAGTGCANPGGSGSANTVSVRGPGNGAAGYCLLSTSGGLPFSLLGATRAASQRVVRFTLDPTADTYTVEMDPTGTGYSFQVVTSGSLPSSFVDETGASFSGIPPRVSLVFTGSSAAATEFQEIGNLSVTTVTGTPPALSLAQTDSTTGPIAPGSEFFYNLTPSLAGAGAETNPASLLVTDPLPQGITLAGTPVGTGWDCSASTGSNVSCSFSGNAASIPAGTALNSIIVPVQASGSTPPGSLANTATVVSSDAEWPVLATDTITIAGSPGQSLATWAQQNPATSPPGRSNAASTFDPAINKTVVFGGVGSSGSELGDTWTYDGTTWAQQTTSPSPPVRQGAALAFDPAIGRVVLFGGTALGAVLGDTWTYDGATWTQLNQLASPSARTSSAMAFDAATNTLLLFGGGGATPGADFGDTWSFNGSVWSQLAPSASPPARRSAAMAFDPAASSQGEVVLFSGSTGTTDTWSFDGTTWSQDDPATSPPARLSSAIAFDPAIGSLVLFGGIASSFSSGPDDDTWSFNGTTWVQQNPAARPPARRATTAALDQVGDLVLFGGETSATAPASDTWTFDPVPSVSTAAPTVDANVGAVALRNDPAAETASTLLSALGAPLKNAPFEDSPFGAAPFGAAPFGAAPFGASPISSSSFTDHSIPPITLNEIPLIAPNNWATELAGTPLAALPVQNVTLQQVVALPHPPAVTLGQFDMAGTPLANLSVAAFLLGTTPIAALGNVCPTVASEAVTCSQLDPSSHSAIAFELAGDDLTPFYTTPPLALSTLTHLVNSPITTSRIVDWAFEQSAVGGIATSALPASVVSCSPHPTPGTCDTLGDAEQEGFIAPGATVGQLLTLPAAVIGGFTLADIVPAILPSQDLPVDSLSLASIEGLIPTPAPNSSGLVTFQVHAQATCQALSLVPSLPPDFRLIPGSAQISIGGGPAQAATLDPGTGAITPSTTQCAAIGRGATSVSATFQAMPGVTLGTPSASVTVSASGFSQAVSVAPVTVMDAQDQPPNTPPPASPTVLGPDTLMLEHIPAAGHTDFFGIAQPAVAGSTVTVTLSHIPAGQDFDLSLFGPPGPQLQPDESNANSPFKNSPYLTSPVGDQTAASGSATSQTPSETVADIPQIPGMVLRAVSAQRGTTDDSIQYVSLAGDNSPFVVQVSGYNGSFSPQPYVIQAHVESPPAPLNCQPRNYNGGGTVTQLPAAPLPARTQALILVDGKRTGDIYGPSGESAVLAAANKLAGTSVAGQSTAMGTVIPIDGAPAVAAAYQAWDAANCDVSKANAVVAAINTLVNKFRAGLKDLRYVVIVGSDEVIPFGRVPDLTVLANEEGFDGASVGGTANATSAALSAGFVLSDDPYGDFTPSPWLNSALFVPQVGVGRLVETPADITKAVNAYVTLGGRFNPTSALTTGYDFMTPAAQLVNSAVSGQVSPGKAALVAPPNNPTWSRSDLVKGNAGAGIPPLSSVASGFLSLNGHYDQFQAESALAFRGTTPDPAITPADLPSNLTNAVLFNMGCHAGLNLADVLVANPTAAQAQQLGDWAQSISSKGGLYMANTGFGEGDTDAVAYSERLLAYYAQNLNGQMTVGQALMFAKQHYVDLGAPSVYDAKAVEEAVFYGLPMYTLGANGAAAPSIAPQVPLTPPAPPPPPPPPANAVTTATFQTNASTQLVPHTDASGHNFFTVNSQFPQVTPYEPVQPRAEIPLPTRNDGLSPHGALIEQLTSTDQPGFNPEFDTPVVDQTSTTVGPNVAQADFPSVLASIDHTLTPSGPLDTLVVVPSQYSQSLERTFGSIGFDIENSNSDDLNPPVISTVDAGVQGNSVGFTVTTPSSDVTRAVALFLPKSGNPAGDPWTHVELANNGQGRWTGVATLSASDANKPIGQYIVQLLDSAGNVATSSNKAVNYAAPVLPVSTGIRILANNAPPTAAPYTASVGINLQDATGHSSGTFLLSVDAAPAAPFTAPVTISSDGAHLVVATNTADGSRTEALIVVSTQGPTVAITTPASGGQYPLGTAITASFTCASLVGIQPNGCTQTNPSPTASLTNTVGSHAFTVKAIDSLGRTTTQNITYSVAAVSPTLTTTNVTVSPTSASLGANVTLTATVAPSVAGGAGPGPTGTVSFFLDGQTVVFATTHLVTASAQVSSAGLPAGVHTITASYSGDANFAPSSSAIATVAVNCATTVSGSRSGGLVLGAGSTCVLNAHITGAITVPKGATLDLEGSTVTGAIGASRPGSVRLCATTIGGGVSVQHATGPVLIGDATDGCAANKIGGSLTLVDNTAGVQAIGNQVGGHVTASGNTGAGPFPTDIAPKITNNGP